MIYLCEAICQNKCVNAGLLAASSSTQEGVPPNETKDGIANLLGLGSWSATCLSKVLKWLGNVRQAPCDI